MKKTLLFAFGTCLGLFSYLSAQVPNGSFESWNSRSSEIPDNWTITGNVSKSSGSSGGNAIKMSNSLSDNVFCIAMQSNFDTGAFYAPYYIYSGTPDSMTVTFKADLGLDTASISAAFTKSGEDIPLAIADVQIWGNSSGWVTKTFPVNYINSTPSLTADSGYLLIHSADPVFGPLSDGTLEIDRITFKYASNSAAPDIPNHNFENWHGASVEYPESWVSYHLFLYEQGVKSSFTSKTTDKFDGTYAIELAPLIAPNPETGFDDTFPNAAVTIRPGLDALESDIFTPSFPVNQRYTSFRGQYKASLSGGDIAIAWVNLFKSGNAVGSAFFVTSASQANYIEFSEDITWDSAFSGNPDSATVALMLTDSTLSSINSLSSRAYFDNLRFDNWNAGLDANRLSRSGIYPNPSSGNISVKMFTGSEDEGVIEVINASGAVVARQSVDLGSGRNIVPMDLKSYPRGIYYIRIQSSTIQTTHKIILIP